MAFDQDAVDEVMRLLQPLLDAIEQRVLALEESPDLVSEPVHPITVTNTYADHPPKTWVAG